MPLPKPIDRVELGGNRPDKHKIFAASGPTVRAYTKKVGTLSTLYSS